MCVILFIIYTWEPSTVGYDDCQAESEGELGNSCLRSVQDEMKQAVR